VGTLYRVRVGRDEYLGTPEEVVLFMARAEGAPGRDLASFMRGVAERLAARMDVDTIDPADAEAFLDTLAEAGVIEVEAQDAPSAERVDPRGLLAEGPLSFGGGVEPDDLPEDRFGDRED
jgi:hypothetical protein